jgi:hypothetical protein
MKTVDAFLDGVTQLHVLNRLARRLKVLNQVG